MKTLESHPLLSLAGWWQVIGTGFLAETLDFISGLVCLNPVGHRHYFAFSGKIISLDLIHVMPRKKVCR